MKKFNLLLMAGLMLGFVACNKTTSSGNVSLKTQEDSLNYCYGLLYGGDIRENVLIKDTTNADINNLLAQIDDEINRNNNNRYATNGYYFGKSLKQQQAQGLGLIGDSLVKLDFGLLKKGLINGMKDHKEGMTTEKAMEYFQTTVQKIQARKMQHQASPVPPADEPHHAQEAKHDSVKK